MTETINIAAVPNGSVWMERVVEDPLPRRQDSVSYWRVTAIQDGRVVMMLNFETWEGARACRSRAISGMHREFEEERPLDPKDWDPRTKRCLCLTHAKGA